MSDQAQTKTSAQKGKSKTQVLKDFVRDAIAKETFDDRVDTRTDITTREVFSIIGRSLRYIPPVKWLFTAKLLLLTASVFPMLLLPWLGKLVMDSAVQQIPVHETEIPYPPFMNPLLSLLEGSKPIDVIFIVTTVYIFLVFLIGCRFWLNTNAGLWAGWDSATQSENRLSAGSSTVGGSFGILEYLINVRLTQHMANRLRSRLFQRLTYMPMEVLDDQRIGDSIYRVLYDVPMGPDLIYQLTLTPIFMVLTATANLLILQYSYAEVAPELIWIACLTIPAAFLITQPFAGPLRRSSQNKRSAGSATTNSIEESLSNTEAVQSLGAQDIEQQRFAERSAESFRRERLNTAVIFAVTLVFGALAGLVALYMLVLVSDRIIDGQMSVGDFAVLTLIFGQISMPAGYFGTYWIKIQDAVAAVRRVYFFLDFESEEELAGSIELKQIRSGVQLRNVSFSYESDSKVLDAIDVDFHIGELVAVVGPTGAGKTTLAYLLPRFLTATSGQVLIDATPIEEVNTSSLREQVTYVFQEHSMVSESIRANLLFSNPDASERDMKEALEAAAIWDFVESLPEGLDTRLGRSGDTLSVGQQQRLSIARGLIRQTPILILDEPTAALDPQTEFTLVNTLKKESENRLVIVIAHRLSTIREADKILFLDEGVLKGVGSHETLMSDLSSPYREYVNLQMG